MNPNRPLDGIPPHWLSELGLIFRQWAPGFEVWAFGSRVTGNCHDASDLDLVLIHPVTPTITCCKHVLDLRKALDDSNLPICVDVMDWASVPAEFHSQINKNKIKLFDASGEGAQSV